MAKSEETAIRVSIKAALEEDVGWGGEDLTTNATVRAETQLTAKFLAKADGVLAGLRVAEWVFDMVDPKVTLQWTQKDGDKVKRGTYFGTVTGSARSLLVGERIALNIMQRMSGVATLTNQMVSKVPKDSPTKILDTRKTMPGLRMMDKMAVRIGGGVNHRVGLHDMIMIKDNHITASGGIPQAVERAHKYLASKQLSNIKVEVETRTLDEVKEALTVKGIDRVMLDNMVKLSANGSVDTSMLQQALKLINGKIETEASGNVTLDTVAQIAATKVDYISCGALTHSAVALDISLKIQMPSEKSAKL